jgi:hypothetical protein
VKRLNRSLLAVTVAFVSIAELASNASASRTTLSATSTPLPSSVEVILKGVHQVSKPAGAPLIDKSGETTYVDLDRTAYIVTASPNVAFTSVKTYFTVAKSALVLGDYGLPHHVIPGTGALFAMQHNGWDHGLKVTADGKGLVGHAGAVLLRKLADQAG